MRKILILALILVPLNALAQWDWNVKPSQQDDFADIYEFSSPEQEMQMSYDILHINPIYLIPSLNPAALEFEEIPGQGLMQSQEDIIQLMKNGQYLAKRIDNLINKRDFKQFSGKQLVEANSNTNIIFAQLVNELMQDLAENCLDMSSYPELDNIMICHGINATTCYDVFGKFIKSVNAGLKGLTLTARQQNLSLEGKNQDDLYISAYGVNRDPETWAEFFKFFSESLKEFMQSNRDVVAYLRK